MMRKIAAILLILIGAMPLSANPMLQEAVDTYNQALETDDAALRSERFRRSARLFGQVIDQIRISNSNLQANLGNAALQSEQLGQAILAYRRALAIDPGHARAKRNIEHARRLLPDWVPRPQSDLLFDTFFTWHRTMSRGQRAMAAALCFALTCILLAIAIRWRRTWARFIAILPAAAWLILMGLTLWQQRAGVANDAVVIAPQTIAHAADAAGAPKRFAEPLVSGIEVTILEQRNGWSRIALASGRDGWVRSSAIERVQLLPNL
jgi:tetratricopeptide (TPR) repeat protein